MDPTLALDSVVARGEPGYPRRLSRVADAPERLYVRGRLWSEERTAVAIVGARAATGEAMAWTRELAGSLAAGGAVVLSGGAIGVDAAAHEGALAAGGVTAAVLGTGLDTVYPARHLELFAAIASEGGALLTSFAPGVPVLRWNFPRRNRTLAGLADAVIVVQASTSSGSLYTARAALAYERVLGARPGSTGTDNLIAQGAARVTSAEEVLAALAGRPSAPVPVLPVGGSDEDRVLRAVTSLAPTTVDALGASLGLPAARALRALCALEMEGFVLPAPGGRYVRSVLADRLLTPTDSAQGANVRGLALPERDVSVKTLG